MTRPTIARGGELGGLVLTRRLGESLMFEVAGLQIRVTIARLLPGGVRIQVQAPRDEVTIWREELIDDSDKPKD